MSKVGRSTFKFGFRHYRLKSNVEEEIFVKKFVGMQISAMNIEMFDIFL